MKISGSAEDHSAKELGANQVKSWCSFIALPVRTLWPTGESVCTVLSAFHAGAMSFVVQLKGAQVIK